MRETLFRGKRIDDNKWTYGYLFKCWGRCYLLWGMNDDNPIKEEVVPETVGEYTGLTDMRGKKIFEGDVVIQKDGLDDYPYGSGAIKYGTFNCGCCHAVYGFYATNEDVDLRALQSEWDEGKEIEVIGNIHDNPELLEVEE